MATLSLYHTKNTKTCPQWNDCMVFNAFSTLFQLYCGSLCTYPCFSGFFLPVLCIILFPNQWLLSYITIVAKMDSRGMNPVGMTIINPILARPGIGRANSCSCLFSYYMYIFKSYFPWENQNHDYLQVKKQ